MSVFRRMQLVSEPALAHSIVRLASVFQLLLMAATWKLWLYPDSFPRVPLIAVWLPHQILTGAACVLAAGCLLLAGSFVNSPNACRRTILLCLAAACLPVLLNQHCLQAWHWLFLLTLASSLLPQPLICLHSVIATIYVCSGLSRLTEFPEQGPAGMIVRQLLSFVGIDAVTVETLRWCCHLASGFEILAGLTLLGAGRYPQVAAAMAIAVHLPLLAALGPFGLRHHSAVLLWNLQLLLLAPLLAITAPRRSAAQLDKMRDETAKQRLLRSVPVGILWLFALSGLFGLADNWPSWQLYSSRPESWHLWIRRDDSKRLPAQFQPWLSPTVIDGWQPFGLDRLSLAATGSPLVPEDRFQAGVIDALLRQCPSDLQFRIRISEPHPWLWWIRRERTLKSRAELQSEQSRFLLNALPQV